MGADFLHAVARMPHYDAFVHGSVREDEALAVLEERTVTWLATAMHMNIQDLLYDALYRHLETEDLEYLEDIDEQHVEELRSKVKPALVEAVQAAAKSVLGYNREVGTISLDMGETWWFITGGMSYGDDPTEAYGEIALLDLVSAWDAPVPQIEKEEEQ